MYTNLYVCAAQTQLVNFFFFLMFSIMHSCKQKEMLFSNIHFDLEKFATAKTGHLYEEEAKEEKNPSYFLWQKKGKQN